MPKVVRTVTRSTMVKKYQSFCEEESFKRFSESLNFAELKVVDVREVSQRRSEAYFHFIVYITVSLCNCDVFLQFETV